MVDLLTCFEHVGSAHTDAELALLLAAARELLSPGQGVLDLGDLPVVPARMDEVAGWTSEPELPLQLAAGGRPAAVSAGGRVAGTSADLLWTVLTSAYARLGFDVLGDDGFRAMVLARIVEPTSKAEVARVLDEIGAPAVSLRTLFRSLARSQARDYRGQLSAAAWAHSVRTGGAEHRGGECVHSEGGWAGATVAVSRSSRAWPLGRSAAFVSAGWCQYCAWHGR